MNEKSKNHVLKIYREYQSSRRVDDINTRFQILSNIRGTEEEQSASFSADEEEEEYSQVLDLYKRYQNSRDPYRDQILANVFSVAEQRAAKSAVEQVKNNEVVDKSRFGGLLKTLGQFFNPANLLQWQNAAAFAAIILVVGTLVLFNIDRTPDNSPIIADSRTQLIEHSQAISSKIAPVLDSTFGFSNNQESYHHAFRFGTMAADFPVLVKTRRMDSILSLVNSATPVVEKSRHNALITAHKTFLSALKNNTGENELLTTAQEFSSAAKAYFAMQGEDSIYQLGEWLEVTLLTTYLSDQKLIEQLPLLLAEGKVLGNTVMGKLSMEKKVTNLIKEFQGIDLDIQPDPKNVRLLREKLQQIKATLS